ncbi:hypothetical protein UFOVP144_30 [uncultured Caudovirales phage]|uniref:Uncharacterized protein n=1 Tax=uncultured Caudovirales phage TaxID=2100421 RepID=A0A6J7XM87_9CAUD|nr:hypothetical protein UFOVP144_30 [uncultured Caudovirales phage]
MVCASLLMNTHTHYLLTTVLTHIDNGEVTAHTLMFSHDQLDELSKTLNSRATDNLYTLRRHFYLQEIYQYPSINAGNYCPLHNNIESDFRDTFKKPILTTDCDHTTYKSSVIWNPDHPIFSKLKLNTYVTSNNN